MEKYPKIYFFDREYTSMKYDRGATYTSITVRGYTKSSLAGDKVTFHHIDLHWTSSPKNLY
jgi:polyisoprenoid-binding protein YceI